MVHGGKRKTENGKPVCAAVILAAGEATRMGVAKPALPFGDSTMVGTVIDTARAAGLDPVVVVTGFHADEVEAVVPEGVVIVRNPDPGRGNMSSLLAGIGAVGDVNGLVLLLSDMPGVTADSIIAVCDAMGSDGRMFSWTRYPDGRGHPIAMTAAGAAEIGGLTGTKALWPFFDELDAASYGEVEAVTPRPVDVNTPADYSALTNSDIVGS